MSLVKLAVPATRLCQAEVRNGLEISRCDATLVRGDCPVRKEHMLPFPTGFCDSGFHEGYKIAKPTCKYIQTCPCKCHQDIWFMFSLSGMDRILMDNSTWTAHATFWMPSKVDMINARVLSSPTVPDVPTVIESPAPGIVPVAIGHVYAPTPSGRAARGELETWVREVTDIWSVHSGEITATPQWIAEEIARRQGLGKSPSSGAVDAVLKRWERIGFASVARKPTRFAGYTEIGIKFGLDFLKAKGKLDGL